MAKEVNRGAPSTVIRTNVENDQCINQHSELVVLTYKETSKRDGKIHFT